LQLGDRTSTLLLRAAALTLLSLAVFAGTFAVVSALLPQLAPTGLGNLCQWDCGWYQEIAEEGYRVEPAAGSLMASYAFYPAFPLLARLVMLVTGLGFVHAALLMNLVMSGAFAWLALAGREELMLRDDRDAAIFVLAFMVSPWSLYNHVPYTEMTFNLAMLATFLAWRRGHFVAAALCGVVLTATRVTGVLLPIALLIELLLQERWRILNLLKAPDGRFRALAIMPLGALGFYLYLGVHVGDPLAAFHAQLGWAQAVRNPLELFIGGLRAGEPQPIAAGLALVVVTVSLAIGLRLGRIPLALGAMGLLTAVAVGFTGFMPSPRYTLAIFPVFLLVPILPRKVQWLLIAVFVAWLCVYLHLWFLSTWFLI
jgi:hypothetical protein